MEQLKQDLLSELSQFTGTLRYHRFNPFTDLVLTDGVQYLATKGGCYWMFDLIAGANEYDEIVKRNKWFIIWRIKVNKDDSAVLEAYRDSPYDNSNFLHRQKIPYTDFKKKTDLAYFEFYQEGNVLLLKSEH